MSFELPPLGSQPIVGGLGRPVGQIHSNGRIDLGLNSSQIRLDGKVFQGDRQVGHISLNGLSLDSLGSYRTIHNGLGPDFRIR